MENIGPILGIVGIAALIGGIAWLAWFMEKKRTEAMSNWAQSRGYSFEGPRPSLVDELAAFKLFNQGRRRTVKNMIRGAKDAGSLSVCDYQYTTGSGKHQQVHQHTIVIMQTPGRHAPHFFVRRQSRFFDALGKLFGGQDINFDDDPAFSKAYVLQTAGDEGQLRGFMRPQLREALTQMQDRNLIIEVVGDTLVVHQNRRLKPDQIDALVTDAVNLRRNWS